jgi:hypothetical protein
MLTKFKLLCLREKTGKCQGRGRAGRNAVNWKRQRDHREERRESFWLHELEIIYIRRSRIHLAVNTKEHNLGSRLPDFLDLDGKAAGRIQRAR